MASSFICALGDLRFICVTAFMAQENKCQSFTHHFPTTLVTSPPTHTFHWAVSFGQRVVESKMTKSTADGGNFWKQRAHVVHEMHPDAGRGERETDDEETPKSERSSVSQNIGMQS